MKVFRSMIRKIQEFQHDIFCELAIRSESQFRNKFGERVDCSKIWASNVGGFLEQVTCDGALILSDQY